MRIIAGIWRGRRIAAPTGQQTRPTADRARETLFSMLVSRLGGFTDLAVADLFAGSGALGLEAMSRGAATCLFIERDAQTLAAIRANITALGAAGATLRAGDAENPGPAPAPFNLIFLDPPYGSVDCGALIDRLITAGWTKVGTVFSVETGHDEAPQPRSACLLTSRKVGKAMLHLFESRVTLAPHNSI
ncbi:MAG: 16S rRNA (guanine(966)-N(2))-methyltransferase RsmD [Sphingopyxis sp.]